MIGQIKRICNAGKGEFGFITCNGEDFFFHRSAVMGDFHLLREGQTVDFSEGLESDKGKRADRVTLHT
jgi:cold shock CspA family protein